MHILEREERAWKSQQDENLELQGTFHRRDGRTEIVSPWAPDGAKNKQF